MRILIVSATSLEIPDLLNALANKTELNQKLKKAQYKKLHVDVLVPGVGMVSTAYWMGQTLARNQYDLAINLGIAGSFDETIEIGSVCHVTKDGFPEMGAEDGEQFLSLLDLDLLEDDDFPFSNGMIDYPNNQGLGSVGNLKKVRSITVNTVHGDEVSIEKTLKKVNPEIESMEGAAFFFACICSNVPCIQIRSISNLVERRNRSNWNIPLAVKNLNTFALQLLEEIDA